MTESEKPRANPDGTIELDRIDSDGSPEVAEEGDASARSVRRTPPPLPELAQQTSVPPRALAPSMPPPAPRSAAKSVGYVVLLVALIAVAIAAGRSVGSRALGSQAIAPTALSASAPISAGSVPSASSDSVLMVPTIEMK
jgi:hypothetical protein